MDLTSFGPLVGQLLQAGAPMISTALQMGVGEIPIVGGIAGPLVGMATPNIVKMIAQKLGAPPDATPQQLADRMAADPAGAKAALASLEAEHTFDLASQAQQVGLRTVEAQSGDKVAARAIPAMLWGLGALLMLSGGLPFLVWALVNVGIRLTAPPTLDPSTLGILSALLGVAAATHVATSAPTRKAR